MRIRTHTKSLLLLLILNSGCATTVPLTFSSLDTNNGAPQTLTLKNTSNLEETFKKVLTLTKERHLALMQKTVDPAKNELKAVFNAEAKEKSKTVSEYNTQTKQNDITTYSGKNNSKYFLNMTVNGNNIVILMVGVPIYEDEVSCPPYVSANFMTCTPPVFTTYSNDLRTSVKNYWGFDISGKTEAETIQGIFAELE